MKEKLLLLTVSFLFIFALGAKGQGITVSGTITSSEDGEPLPGVNILVQGTTSGAVTNLDGRYSLNVPSANSTLIISSIGFVNQEVFVNGRSVIDVRLTSDAQQLQEVVVTAFGIEREKKALGYSVQEVDPEELTQAREVNVVNSLKGKVAGVHINPTSGTGSSSYVVIRGNSSLTGDNQPLFVVDGVPIDNQTLDPSDGFSGIDYGDGIANINPDDIANVSVLKGPSAAAMYGARGANGVILITTKTGKKGKGIGIDFNTNATFDTPNVTPTFQNTWGGGYDDDYGAFGSKTIDGEEVMMWPSWMNDHWGGRMDGRPITFQHAPEFGVVPYNPQPRDNIENFYQTGTTFSNTIGISGGNDKSTIRLSLADMQNESIVPNTTLSRQNITLRASHQVTDRLLVDGKINYVRQEGRNRNPTGVSTNNVAASLNILARVVDLDWLKDYKRDDGVMRSYKSGIWPYNPYWLVNEVRNEDTRDRMIGMVRVKYDFTDWLSVQARTGTDFYTDDRFAMIPQGTPHWRWRDGEVSNTMWKVKEENSDILLTASGDLSSDFAGSFSVGANHLNREQEKVQIMGRNLDVPGLYHIENAGIVFPENSLSRRQMNSVYFMGQVAYKNYLFVDVTGRNDWSSTLGVNNRSFFYPSVSTSFVFTDALLLDSRILTFGKLRASYAEAGNDAAPFQTTAGYSLNSTSFNGLRLASIRNTVPLADLKNELTTSYEIGMDLRLFNSRLGIDFTYYDQSTTNQILPVEISAATGFRFRMINAGEIRNKGLELMINSTILKAGDFSWDMGINLSRNRSEVVALAPGISTHTLMYSINRATIEAREGESYGNIIGHKFLRNEAGQKVVTEQGKWRKAPELEILGNIQPDFLAGLSNSFSFKGFVLTSLLDVRKGGQVFSSTKYDQMAKGTGIFTEHRENLIAEGVIDNGDGTYRENTNVIVAHQYYAEQGPWGAISEVLVIDADYVALREMTFGYNFSPGFLQKTPFTNAKISVVGRNLLYLYRDPEFKTMGVSPETAFSSSAAAQGHEARGIPTTKSLGFNLSLSF